MNPAPISLYRANAQLNRVCFETSARGGRVEGAGGEGHCRPGRTGVCGSADGNPRGARIAPIPCFREGNECRPFASGLHNGRNSVVVHPSQSISEDDGPVQVMRRCFFDVAFGGSSRGESQRQQEKYFHDGDLALTAHTESPSQ